MAPKSIGTGAVEKKLKSSQGEDCLDYNQKTPDRMEK